MCMCMCMCLCKNVAWLANTKICGKNVPATCIHGCLLCDNETLKSSVSFTCVYDKYCCLHVSCAHVCLRIRTHTKTQSEDLQGYAPAAFIYSYTHSPCLVANRVYCFQCKCVCTPLWTSPDASTFAQSDHSRDVSPFPSKVCERLQRTALYTCHSVFVCARPCVHAESAFSLPCLCPWKIAYTACTCSIHTYMEHKSIRAHSYMYRSSLLFSSSISQQLCMCMQLRFTHAYTHSYMPRCSLPPRLPLSFPRQARPCCG
jgi:hypothetical protein